ncbi:hypothetical protein GN958_ATG02831 [Phytophthora infestans]|uniref:Uncharacterized protein n=1 Tax=Phytophthora infestans TaxID=4787 RepID=A0A8S9V579_PHYIN|nr:hypothetical protein GN958_ATG02831 [Phytophthora infestans]
MLLESLSMMTMRERHVSVKPNLAVAEVADASIRRTPSKNRLALSTYCLGLGQCAGRRWQQDTTLATRRSRASDVSLTLETSCFSTAHEVTTALGEIVPIKTRRRRTADGRLISYYTEQPFTDAVILLSLQEHYCIHYATLRDVTLSHRPSRTRDLLVFFRSSFFSASSASSDATLQAPDMFSAEPSPLRTVPNRGRIGSQAARGNEG